VSEEELARQTPAGRARRTKLWWVVNLAALLGMAVTASLGRWQLSRAEEKLAYQAMLEARAQEPELTLTELQQQKQPLSDQLLHRRVELEGFWRSQYSVWLDNRSHHGQAGYWVLTPLQLDADTAVLVQRGWAPRISQNREQLPEVATSLEVVSVEGYLSAGPSRLLQLGQEAPLASSADKSAETASGSSRIRQNLDLNQFRQETGIPIVAYVVQTDEDAEGLRRDWPVVGSTADKNYGYAFQWFALCLLILVLTVWFQFIQPARYAKRSR
jgi:surfeit locus 1 family protein